jgi:dihydroorotate dehydrogenase (fumarate)
VYDALKAVKQAVTLPVAVKLAPFFSSLPNVAFRLEELGAAGLVLFNRFYQPDVDLEQLQAVPTLRLSNSSELLLRLRWLAILAGRFAGSLACSGGVHEPTDAAKAIMCGADAVQVVSALLERGPQYLKVLKQGLSQWLEEHEYDSLRQMQRSMSLLRCPDPANFERANYIRALQNWRPSTV